MVLSSGQKIYKRQVRHTPGFWAHGNPWGSSRRALGGGLHMPTDSVSSSSIDDRLTWITAPRPTRPSAVAYDGTAE